MRCHPAAGPLFVLAALTACAQLEPLVPAETPKAELVMSSENKPFQTITGPLKGRIVGLNAPGLVLSDGQGNVLRPPGNATEFQFPEGEAFAQPFDQAQLVVRQPLGQVCRVAVSGAGADGYEVRCQGAKAPVSASMAPRMRDCFLVSLRGAAFNLVRNGSNGVEHYADVSLDPVGPDRQHHRTLLNGRLALEAITFFPMQASIAQVEWLALYDASGAVVHSSQGLSGGMPLDLEIGEERAYNVTVLTQQYGEPYAQLRATRRQVKLLDIGQLNTRAGLFPLTCRLRETNVEGGVATEVWYAPGYGPVKMQVLEAGEWLEVLEIKQLPDH